MRAVALFLSLMFVAASGFAADDKTTGKPTPDELLYLATWPHTIRVIDIGKEKVVDQIELPTDIARILLLSPDKTKLYASSLRDNSIVTVDLKTRKVIGSFSVNDETETNRLSGLTIDPTGKYLYSVITTVTKKLDHYEIGEPKVAVIDLEAKKITRRGDFPKHHQP